jgi:hypothetical protein
VLSPCARDARRRQADEALHCLAEAAQIKLSRLLTRGTTRPSYTGCAVIYWKKQEMKWPPKRATDKRSLLRSDRVSQLRAATSLARLWRDQGKRTAARHLLGPMYDWFTEGFDTPVLTDTKSLLDELA